MTTTARSIALLVLAAALFAGPAGAGDANSYSATEIRELINSGDYEKVLEKLKSAYSLYPYNAAIKGNLAYTYALMAQRDLKASRYAESAQYYGEARELLPDNKEFGLMRGIALYLGKNYDSARAEFEQNGDSTQSLIYRGKISYDTGDLPAAISLWRRALDAEPGNKTATALIEKAERELPVESKMEKGYSSMFDLSFDAELPPGLSAEVLDALEAAYNSVGADLGHFPKTRIPVLLYTRSDYSSVTAGPDWSGGLYDGKIRLPVGGVTKVSKQMRGIIFHEYTHVVIGELTRGNIPTWLNEGIAVIEEKKEFNHSGMETRAAKEGRLIPLSTLSGSFTSMTGAEATQAYQQSYSMANFMVSRYGWFAVQGILKSLGERATVEAAVSQALANYALDLPGVMAEWRESVK